MTLSLKDRLNFVLLFPEKGNIIQQILVADISKKVSLTQDEIKEFELKQEGTVLKWNEEKAKDIEVEFTEAELNLLKEQIKELDSKGEITQAILPLCLKLQKA